MHQNDRLSYRQRLRLKLCALLFVEIIHTIWQIYGNFIYYQPSMDQKVRQCQDEKNQGFQFAMYLMILLGYVYFMIYLILLCLYFAVLFRRVTNQRSRISQSSDILRTISRVRFSEELFGAISDENECIICMMPFNENDMITKLNCDGNHFFHTACIENWIRQGSN